MIPGRRGRRGRRPRVAAGAVLLGLGLAGCEGGTGPGSVPDVPDPLLAAPESNSEVSLSWRLSSAGVERVEIQRAEGEGTFEPLVTLDGPVLAHQDTGLAPATAYRYRVRACGAGGCSPFAGPAAATTFGTLRITTTTLPGAVAGSTLQQPLQSTGGSGTVSFEVVAGALPPGVSLGPDGVLTGTPTATGSFRFTVRATSADGQRATAEVVLEVRGVLVVTTTSLPTAHRGRAYSAGLHAEGGDGVYTWTVDAGSPPAGLTLSERGILSGTPDTEQTARFTVRVRSGDGQTAARELTLQVVAAGPPTVSVETPLLPPGVVGAPWEPVLTARGGGGEAVTWAVVAGALPPGVALGAGGGFSGSPTTPGTFTFTVRASADGQSDHDDFTVRIVPDRTGRYDLTRFDVVDVPPDIAPHVDAALARWEGAITGDLEGGQIRRGFFDATHCGGFGDLLNGTSLDDLIVVVNIAPIDGRGRILGQAGPCGIRDDRLPFAGTLTLDSEDLQPLVGTATLTHLIFHEIGHILGFGTLWSAFDHVSSAGGIDPRFKGANAVREFRSLGGQGFVPLETQGGEGTKESHWRESHFDREIMTGFTEAVGVPQPLSRVTLGSLADLGYTVNLGAADAFTLPPPPAQGAPSAEGEALGWDVVDRGPILMLPLGDGAVGGADLPRPPGPGRGAGDAPGGLR